MRLTAKNYYSKKANMEFCSYSEFKNFCGIGSHKGCETMAMAKLNGEWEEEPSQALLEGAYIDRYFEGTLDSYIEENWDTIHNRKGDKYAPFLRCDEAIERCKRDDLFMLFMSGEKQAIFTFELFGLKWKSKLDSYHPGKCIVDLKYIKDIRETFYVPDTGRVSWLEYYGYDYQGALYQKAVEINTGDKLPYYIAVVDKGKYPDIEIVQIPQSRLDNALSDIEYQSKRYKAVKYEGAEPERCGKCNYCKATKKLTTPISIDMLDI